jgi:hypothetical protein
MEEKDFNDIGFELDSAVPTLNGNRFLFYKDFERYGRKLSCGILYVVSTNHILVFEQEKRVEGVFNGGYCVELVDGQITIAGGTLFAGEILNKSELTWILQRVGVLPK